MTKISITSEQLKQLKRFVEDGIDRTVKQFELDKDSAQRIIEQGDKLLQSIAEAMCELAKPKPVFKYDKTKDGWELIENVGFEPPLTYIKKIELISFLKDGESYINSEVMVERAKNELHANLGQQHAEYLLEHQSEIPKEFQKYYLVFLGTKWRPGGYRCVPYLEWDGGKWLLCFRWLDNSSWDDDYRLVRPRE